jgi:hypothetical protein
MKTPSNSNAAKHVAEICLYGTSSIGAGWLALVRGEKKPFGEHTPSADRSFTEAVWAAVEQLKDRGVAGTVRVFAPGGERVAEVDTRAHVPAFGDLPFRSIG